MRRRASQIRLVHMKIDLTALPDDVETLQRMVRSLAAERATLSAAQAEIERLHLIIKKLQRTQFGRRAERVPVHAAGVLPRADSVQERVDGADVRRDRPVGQSGGVQ